MKATHGRKLLNGDIANLSIGQGDAETTPLQMAQAMAIIGNGGTFYQTRLVQQVQTVDNEIVTAFQVRAKKTLGASADTMEQLRVGLINVVNGPAGTAHQASLENVEVAGKTGTAQWGPKNKERTAAWFAGFVPAEQTAVCVRRPLRRGCRRRCPRRIACRADDRDDLEGDLQRKR